MPEERWDRIRELFHQAVDLPRSSRDAFLKRACTDAALRDEVESLLAQTGATLLDAPAVAGVRDAIQAGIEREPVVPGPGGTVDSRYHLLEKIGEGGMGEVWRVEQTEPIRRQLAFKLVKAGMNTREVIARFETERQTLALMDHHAIAKVVDAGSTAAGAPYFVMEYVDGAPITAFCDTHRLTVRERLELFIRVCEGVQHAHQKAIIHRDLKPSNILVTEVDGNPTPKIIDWGIAKALGRSITAESMITRTGALVGTLEYMSPEQAASAGQDIDTRTDVYSLGIVLYELIAGARPIELQQIGLEQFLRRLREEEPERPSTRIAALDHATASEVASKRQTAAPALVRLLSGDLDSIILKALEKDRSRRYGSPSDLAADIARYLKNEPVSAIAPSADYLLRKFVRRYRVALVTAAAFALVLLVAAAVSIRQGIRAKREAAAAQALNDFLRNDLLAQASASTQAGPQVKPDPDLKVRTALDRAAARIASKFDRQPEVEAAIRDTLGQTYMDLGVYPEAQAQLERALELDRRAIGISDPKTLRIMSRLAYAAFLRGNYPRAETLNTQALDVQRRVLGPDNPDTLDTMSSLAILYSSQGKYPKAETLDRQILDTRRRLLGPEHPDTLSALNNMAMVTYAQGKYSDAETLFTRILQIRRHLLGPEHPKTLGSMNNLAVDYQAQSKYPQAEALNNEALDIRRRVLGPEHPDTLYSVNNLANVYYFQGKYGPAASLYLQTAEAMRRVLGREHPDTLTAMNNLAAVYRDQGRYAQSEELDRQVLAIRRRVSGPEHPDTLLSMNNLANDSSAQARYAEAEALFRQTLEARRRVLGLKHPLTLTTLSDLASMYQHQGKYSLAESHAAETLAGRRESLGAGDVDTIASLADVALACESQGKFTEAEPLARESFGFQLRKQPDDWQRFRAESLLGASLAGQKKFADAEPLLLEGYNGMLARKDRIAVPDRYHLDRARESIVHLYLAAGQTQKAAGWRKK